MATSRGFVGHRRGDLDPSRVPPGQYITDNFPVLSAGPTPTTSLATWTFEIRGAVDEPVSWTWEELNDLPQQTFTADIHCVTKWSKLGSTWSGIPMDALLSKVTSTARHALAFCDGDYTTNVPVADLTGGRAWIVFTYAGSPLTREHGGPARLLIPHLYLWKSAKWIRGLELRERDAPGFWERYGYHNYGDPWREQRYSGD